MLLSAGLSDLLGYTSIACWLGAQFPQVIENARRQSVEGLALPFLMNWLLGDTTNLIGCILTHQLPFQTYLATYFCFVDFSLLAQYYYYMSRAPKDIRPPYLHSRDRTAPSTIAARRLSLDRGPGAPHYRALSNVAANVAAVAALAAQQEEQGRWHGRSHSTEPHPTTYDDDDDVSEDALARLTESFHSDGGRSSRRKQVVWGHDSFTGSRGPSAGRSRQSSHMPAALQMSSPPTEEVDPFPRGRPLVRAADREDDDEEWLSTSAQRRSSRASRKGATMVFLGVWALFGVGTLTTGRSPLSTGLMERTGQVLTRAEVPIPPSVSPEPLYEHSIADAILSAQLAGEPAVFEFSHSGINTLDDHPDTGPSTEFIIGRISAWICTTLYLTSRLPQIWKNYVRKSVEGLSIYLFIFAFLGNFFYVASILTSPNLQLPEPQASAFIRESIPYLLGSGGTLMFDVTIVTQAFLYSPKSARGRRPSHSYNEEEAGLLSGEATGRDASPVTSRRRGGSVSRDTSVGFP
ncbi:PQ-loop-domain-containing protein [Lentinus tigrinus ALCF2SS1-7]|uniref:PQ-loop-domain-containing protein n=1 Tax=Lentinus tigrinus ALCF2SS1-6 TaxID=1328759 RepID=A0A5C2SST9_9APHY|nr:PQ-loop-domain-containing protein [Lentinus tigrinus ALCF2SS1-6]RPD80071.1 PQ-loop-domain-containing protein [Lentinus tigrinus ALCF2SS1-7]